MEGGPFALGVQLDASPAAIADGTPLALDFAPAAHQTGGHLAVLILGLHLLPQLAQRRHGICSGLGGVHGCSLTGLWRVVLVRMRVVRGGWVCDTRAISCDGGTLFGLEARLGSLCNGGERADVRVFAVNYPDLSDPGYPICKVPT